MSNFYPPDEVPVEDVEVLDSDQEADVDMNSNSNVEEDPEEIATVDDDSMEAWEAADAALDEENE